jgi:hypothetical protein
MGTGARMGGHTKTAAQQPDPEICQTVVLHVSMRMVIIYHTETSVHTQKQWDSILQPPWRCITCVFLGLRMFKDSMQKNHFSWRMRYFISKLTKKVTDIRSVSVDIATPFHFLDAPTHIYSPTTVQPSTYLTVLATVFTVFNGAPPSRSRQRLFQIVIIRLKYFSTTFLKSRLHRTSSETLS